MSSYPWSGVFCLEGEWNDEKLKDRSSVLPALELLERLDLITFVHRDVATRAELEHYLARWTRERLPLNVLYLAFHGTPDGIAIADAPDHEATLEYLGGLLAGKLKGRVVHFGACSVLRARPKKMRQFTEQTGAKVVLGYREDVDWIESMAWDMIVLSTLAHYKQLGTAVKRINQDSRYASLRKALDFRVIAN